MNILVTKREEFANELTKLAVAKDAEIAEKVAIYKASLESQEDEKMSKLRSSIEAIDILLANKASAFEYDIVDEEDELECEDDEIEESTVEAYETASSDEATSAFPECFRKKTLSNQRPGMTVISTPNRH